MQPQAHSFVALEAQPCTNAPSRLPAAPSLQHDILVAAGPETEDEVDMMADAILGEASRRSLSKNGTWQECASNLVHTLQRSVQQAWPLSLRGCQ